jgi:hypothetical protein
MAIVKTPNEKIKDNHATLCAVKYIIADDNKAFMVSKINIPDDLTAAEIVEHFEMTRKAHGQDKGIIAHHVIQSFSPDDDITPEQAHQIGLEFIEKAAPNFEIIFSTHIDKGHIHNHFIINSCNTETGNKYLDNTNSLNHLKEISDELCREHGLKVIEKRGGAKSIDQATYQSAVMGKSWKAQLTSDIDEALTVCKSKIDFIDFLNKKGYKVRYTDNHITITKVGEERGVRVNTLAKQFGKRYAKENLEAAMGYRSLAPPTVNSIRPKNPRPPQRYVTEWQKYEKHYFKDETRKTAERAVWSVERSLMYTNSAGIFLLRLMFLVILKSAVKRKTLTPAPNPMRYKKSVPKKMPIKNLGRKTAGNISYKELKNADGDNITVKITSQQLYVMAMANAPFFYSAAVDFAAHTALVTFKAHNIEKFARLTGYDKKQLDEVRDGQNNSRIYQRIKNRARTNNVKPEYRVIRRESLEKLREDGLEFAWFTRKEDERLNICFMPEHKERVYNLLAPPKPKQEAETPKQRNALDAGKPITL